MCIDPNVVMSVKRAMRISDPEYNDEVVELIQSAVRDLGLSGVTNLDLTDPLILTAVKTYCRLRFGQPDDYDKLKQSYDEQKAQLDMATGYTDWGDG